MSYLAAAPALVAIQRVETMGKSGILGGAAEAIDELAGQVQRLKEALAHCPRK